jgi:archaellum component FlaF (FlaF/FlaG flagellin family)
MTGYRKRNWLKPYLALIIVISVLVGWGQWYVAYQPSSIIYDRVQR